MKKITIGLLVLLPVALVYGGIITKPYTKSAGQTLPASEFNANFDTIYNEFNGNIDAANLKSDAVGTDEIQNASVTPAKMDTTGSYQMYDNAVTYGLSCGTFSATGYSTFGSSVTISSHTRIAGFTTLQSSVTVSSSVYVSGNGVFASSVTFSSSTITQSTSTFNSTVYVSSTNKLYFDYSLSDSVAPDTYAFYLGNTLRFHVNGSVVLQLGNPISIEKNIYPGSDNALDLGSSAVAWASVTSYAFTTKPCYKSLKENISEYSIDKKDLYDTLPYAIGEYNRIGQAKREKGMLIDDSRIDKTKCKYIVNRDGGDGLDLGLLIGQMSVAIRDLEARVTELEKKLKDK